MTSGAPTGARAWLGRRTRTQKGGAVAALTLAATAPFGGLATVVPAEIEALEIGEPFDLGPFEVTVQRVVSTPDLEPVLYLEDEDNRVLSVVVTVENVTDRPESLLQLSDAFIVTGVEVAAGATPDLVLLIDGSHPSWLNPGMVQEMALIVEHEPAPEQVAHVETLGYSFVDEGTLTLDEDYWLPTEEPVRAADIPVERRR